jgi:hypothetical protein
MYDTASEFADAMNRLSGPAQNSGRLVANADQYDRLFSNERHAAP